MYTSQKYYTSTTINHFITTCIFRHKFKHLIKLKIRLYVRWWRIDQWHGFVVTWLNFQYKRRDWAVQSTCRRRSLVFFCMLSMALSRPSLGSDFPACIYNTYTRVNTQTDNYNKSDNVKCITIILLFFFFLQKLRVSRCLKFTYKCKAWSYIRIAIQKLWVACQNMKMAQANGPQRSDPACQPANAGNNN